MASVTLRPGRERPVQQRHPWVFSGAIAQLRGQPRNGDVVEVHSAAGEWLARGTWSGASQIRIRLFTWDADEPLDDDLFRRRLERAISGRNSLFSQATASVARPVAYRLVAAESDGLPGLIVDQYGDYLVIQLLTQGVATRANRIIQILAELRNPRGIYERSDSEVREKEALPFAEGLRWGEEAPVQLQVQFLSSEVRQGRGGSEPHFIANLDTGQKTGLYLDQADNRLRVAAYCRNQQVLDCFCYTGGFTLYAAWSGASALTAIDSSVLALEKLQAQVELNGINTAVDAIAGDVFSLLRQYRTMERYFDVIILDPPKFVHNQAHLERATRGYKDINLLAVQLLRPGGILATCSCSGLVSADLFQKVVFGAAVDARRDVQILERLAQSPDHPVLLSFPEGEYLKGLICRVW
ncbi:MAG: class I SAM-dependent methyltransferase [Chloroflexales bacterium]|nr:class I SAM-dependent methyltransferase [Chloroflexales bacterium]